MAVKKFNKNELHGKSIYAERKERVTSYPLHWHDYFEMILYVGCRGSCTLNDCTYEISDPCIFLLTPTDFHKIDTEDKDGSYYVKVAFCESVIDDTLFGRGALCPKIYRCHDEFIISCFEKLADNEVMKSPLRARALLNYILAAVDECGKEAERDGSFFHPLVRRAAIYTLDHFTEPITLAEVAEKLGTGAPYLSTVFHKTMGRTYNSWLRELRIEHAKRLLVGDGSIIEIAMDCGFGTPSHFSKAFRDLVGMTPGEYRIEARRLK